MTKTPKPKVMAGGLGGAVTVVLVWTLGLAGVDVPAAVASAITVVVTFVVGYLTHDEPAANDLGNAP